jgi:hypothetical protein
VADPCDPATFNAKVCKAAVGGGAYCSRGARIATNYSQSYPYYYDQYRSYTAQGGAVIASPAELCPGHLIHGGFGATGLHHGAGSRAGS